MSERYLCIRNFSGGFGERISEWERNLTANIHNFRVEKGSLCDLYGVEKICACEGTPLSVLPSPYGEHEMLFCTETGVYACSVLDGSVEKTVHPNYGTARSAIGEFRGRSIGVACETGVYICTALGEILELSSRPAQDICFLGGRWFFLSEGSLFMTKPYSLELEAEGEIVAGTMGEVSRCFTSQGKVLLLSRRAVYVLSGSSPEDFTLTVVPLLKSAFPESAAADCEGLYFLTARSLVRYVGGKIEEYPLPGGETVALPAGGAAVGGEYRFFFQGKTQKKEGAFDVEEKTVFLGAGRGITFFKEGDGEFYAIYGNSVGKTVNRAVVDGIPLYKFWRSRPTDFGRLSGRKVLKGASVFAETPGRMVVSSESGSAVVPLGVGNNERRLLLGGARFTIEISSCAPGSRFVKPVIIFSE